MNIHKEGYATLIGSGIGIIMVSLLTYRFAAYPIFIVLTIIGVALWLFLVSFFRNPNRVLENEDSSMVYCPADGKIVVVEETQEDEVLKDRRIQVSIFMSPLNVHVNRNPISAEVVFSKYHPGKFLPAWDPKASLENERTTVVYDNGKHKILMRQIAGALARRIVCYLNKGDQVVQGEDMGFIKLGSRVDLFFPLGTEILVRPDQVVKGNIDRIAKLN